LYFRVCPVMSLYRVVLEEFEVLKTYPFSDIDLLDKFRKISLS
jgi:hypothetical protein